MEAFMEEFQHLKIQLEEIKSATGNFDKSNIIGKCGFGMVYKGVLSHSEEQNMVAFKRLDRNYGQGDPEFWKEILMLSCYKHENLISLLGFCDEDGEKILVYEYASHGSLDRHLSSTTLMWRQRLKVCLSAAKGLSYLHDPNRTHQRVLHRDIKSSNILLDQNWNAKVSDMGLSKIRPANQPHSFLATNVVGTWGYIDPMYIQTSILTKESDVYSFGVVLFEVLCGRLCYDNNNGHIWTLGQTWRKSYKHKKLDEIIFQDLKQHMDPSSLEIFSDIAYRCLHKFREERPNMSTVVEKLEIALRFQENSEDVEPLVDYQQICKTVVPPLVYKSEEELKMLLSRGIFINGGKTWFCLNEKGEHCILISAAECLIPIHSVVPEYANYISRFVVDYYTPFCSEFKTHVKTKLLSPHITYKVNLVFNFAYRREDYVGLNYLLVGETKILTTYLAEKREDGWLMAELYELTNDGRIVDLEITFRCQEPLAVEGIEFQPIEKVEEHQIIEDMEVDVQTVSELSDTYCDQKLQNHYEDIIKWSKNSLHWTTKKELYSILCIGFPISNGREWFSLGKNGKKCHMLSSQAALRRYEWGWRSLPESRFEEVAFDPCLGSIWIGCSSKMLSPQTTYEIYLVYKLQENHSGYEPPLKVTAYGIPLENYHSCYIFLLNPLTPIIRQNVYENSHNVPLCRPKKKGLPRQRRDGWMEVQLWEFQTGTTSTPSFSKNLRLSFSENNFPKGLIVQGIEFKPL